MKFKKTLSLFAIYLVLSLIVIIPMQVSGFSVQISGEDGVTGYRNVEDKTIINATAESPVSINKAGTDYPMTCSNKNGIYFCNHEFEKATLQAGEYVLSFSQVSGTPQSVSWSFTVDEDAPLINSFTVEPKGNGKLGLSYDVSDSAFFYDSSKCSGIKSIVLSSDEETIFQQQFPEHICTKEENNYSIDVSGITGDVQFYLTVTDKLGHMTTSNSNVLSVDFAEPVINNDLVIKAGNRTLEYVSQQPQIAPLVTLQFTVTEENLLSVVADLSEVSRNPEHLEDYSSKVLNCQNIGLKSICKAENIEFNPGKGTINIPVIATDKTGNVVEKTLTKQLTLINKAGEITYFGPTPEHCDGVNCYVKNNGLTKVMIQIQSADAGIDKSLITLATGEFSGVPFLHPSRCNETVSGINSVNECFWSMSVRIPGDTSLQKKLVLTRPSTDLMGTELKGITSSLVIVDSKDPVPVISDVTKNIIKSIPGCTIAGENLDLSILMTDDVSTKLFIETKTNLTTGITDFRNECIDDGTGNFNCTLRINDFVSYPEEETISLDVLDLAGNKYSQEFNLSVCEANNEYPPNFISSITSSTNFKIDRRVASVMPVKVYLPLDIHIRNNAEILDITHDNCIGMEELGGQPYIIAKTSNKPVLVVPIGGTKGTLLEDTIDINCTLSIYEKRGSVRFLQPEVEPLIAKVSAYELMLGDISSANTAKLKSIEELILEERDTIESHEKFASWADKICGILDGINMIGQVASYVRSGILLLSLGLNAVTVTKGIAALLWKLCTPLHKLTAFTNNLFSLGSTGLGGLAGGSGSGSGKALKVIGMLMKLGCLVYQCGLCSADGVVNAVKITSSIVKTAATPSTENAANKIANAEGGVEIYEENVNSLTTELSQQEMGSLYDSQGVEVETGAGGTDWTYGSGDVPDFSNTGSSTSGSTSTSGGDIVIPHAGPDGTAVVIPGSGSSTSAIDPKINKVENDLADEKVNLISSKDNLNNVKKSAEVPTNIDTFETLFTDVMSTGGGGSNYFMDPFANIHNSKYCFCAPGMLYNHQKKEQLLCKEYKCIQTSIELGLPYTHCVESFDEGICLYYDGAMNDRFGWLGELFKGLVQGFLESAPGLIHGHVCKQDYSLTKSQDACGELDEVWKNTKGVVCTVTGAALQIKEWETMVAARDMLSGLFGGGDESPLEKTDYCEGLTFDEVEP